MRGLLAAGAAFLLLAAASPAGAQSSSFSGTYRLTLTFAPACNVVVRSVSVDMSVSEAVVTAGSEVTGRPARPDEADVAKFVLLRKTGSLHGAIATFSFGGPREPITTTNGLLTVFRLMMDGVPGTSSGRPSASGSAFGELSVGQGDAWDSLGYCDSTGHTWSLDPR